MTFARAREHELMDRPDIDPGELARGLADLRAVNRWLGGRRTATRLVLEVAGRVPGSHVRVLDVGTGSGDLPIALAAAARRRKVPLRIVGLDRHARTVEAAKKSTHGDPDIEIVEGDALDLPFGNRTFDIAMCHTALHHFERGDAARVISEMDRVARWGVVVTDLSRSRPALLGARLLAATLWRSHPVTRHDGPASVRAAFTPGEVAALMADAVGEPVRARREPIFRLSAVLDRTLSGPPEAGIA